MYFIQLPFMHAGNYPQRRMGAGLFYGDREQPFGGGNPTDPSNLYPTYPESSEKKAELCQT